MATIKKFEELDVWQLARKLNRDLIPHLEAINQSRNYGLKNQLESSAGSVMDNIAEGFERDGSKEFIQFLAISKGSLGEVRSQIYRAFDRRLLTEAELEVLQNDCNVLAAKIASFINYLRSSGMKGNKFK